MSVRLIFSALALLFQIYPSMQDPVIEISSGKILGRVRITSEHKSFYAFEKIPYAAPPVGNLRFKPPQPVSNWNGILNTTRMDVACYQVIVHGSNAESEDCLFLNVFTPKLRNGCNNKPLPVMVYIHGGGYLIGTSSDYSPDLFINNDVILVTINYRLGIFGFISTQDDVIPGNIGLKDQVFAFKWVQKNIHYFGGDPTKVTIFGQSSGGSACSFHLLNKKSSGLFHGAIIESGSSLMHGIFQRESRKMAFTVGAMLNSTFKINNDSNALVDYFRSLDSEKLNNASEQFLLSQIKPWTFLVDEGGIWTPVIEVPNPDAFLTEKMYGLLKAGNVLKVPVMSGFTSEESIIGNGDPVKLRNVTLILDAHLDLLVPDDMRITDLKNRTKVGEKIRKMYTGGRPFSENLGAFIRYSSDTIVTRAMIKEAELYSKVAKNYFYQFSYDGIIGNVTDHYQGAGTVGHTEELNYLFCNGTECTDPKYPKDDLLTRQRLIKLWTNFAKYQNPTPRPERIFENVRWPHVSTVNGDFFYLNINDTLQVQNHPKHETYEKWVKLYDQLDFDDFDTY